MPCMRLLLPVRVVSLCCLRFPAPCALSSLTTAMDFQRPNHLSRREALQLISGFFPKEWRQISESDLHVDRVQVGLNNEIYFVSREARNAMIEPSKLVIRKFSSIARDLDAEDGKKQAAGMWISAIEETVVCMEMAKRGLGPQLYGIFEGGRIEEFIDCHNITHAEACQPDIEQDIAINLARMHSSRLPLKKPAYRFIDALRSIHRDAMEQRSFYQSMGDETLMKVVQHDYESEFKLMEPLLDLKHHRIVFMHWDSHFGNIVVRNKLQQGQSKTMILDYEIAGYNMRGKDLGTFLISRSGFFPFARPDRKLESSQQFSPFLTAYLNECERQFSEIDRRKMDSLDHVMAETLVGGMTSSLCYLLRFMFLVAKKRSADPDSCEAKTLATHMPVLFEAFTQCKEALYERFPDPINFLMNIYD